MLKNTKVPTQTIQIQKIIEQMKIYINLQYNQNTKTNYKYALKNFNKYIETQQIKEIPLNKNVIETILKSYKKYLINSNYSNKTINLYLTVIQNFFKYIGISTTIKKVENTTNSKEYKYLTIPEIKKLIETIPETTNKKELQLRNKTIILLMFSSGLRVNELINIKANDYYKQENNYYISIKPKGKLNNIILPIAPETSQAINLYLENKKKNNKYLFSNQTHNKLTRQGINKILKQIAIKTDNKYNLNITPRISSHIFRHSLARYLLIDKAKPINQVKDILRHNNINTTIKYLTTSQNEINEIRINILNGF